MNPTFSPRSLRALVLGEATEVHAVEDHGTSGRGIESGEQPEQRRLSASGRPDDRDERALWHGERDVA